MNLFYVYAYLREDGTPYYIGKGRGRRAYNQSDRAILPPKDKTRIKILLDNLTEEQAFVNEIDYIKWYGRKNNDTGILRNLTNGGEGPSGMIHSEETKKRMSEKQKGKIVSDKTREKLRISGLSRKSTEETKRKISISRKGKLHSEESKKKMSDSRKGKPGVKRSEEAKKKQSESMIGKYAGENNPFYGKTHSKETIEKIIEANRNRVVPQEQKEKISIAAKKRWEDKELRKKMSEKLKGRVCTDEHRRKQSESAKRRWQREKSKSSESSLEKFLGNSNT